MVPFLACRLHRISPLTSTQSMTSDPRSPSSLPQPCSPAASTPQRSPPPLTPPPLTVATTVPNTQLLTMLVMTS